MKSWDQMSPLELRDSGKREAIPELIRRLSSGSNAERCQATTALNHYAQHYFEDVSAAIPEMLELAADSFYPARRHALQSIKVLSSALTDDHRRRLSALAASEDRDANRKLIGEILGSPNGEPPNRSDGGDAPRTETPTDPSTLRIGIGHLFATGSNLGRDAIFHIGGVRLSDGQAPEYDDWIVNPNRRITKRLYEKSRVTNARAESSAGWSERRSQITRFFDGLDVLFVFNLYQEREWFDRHVVRELNRRPVVVDLHEMGQFFLPDRTFYDLDELIARAVPVDEWRKSEPRLPFLLTALRQLLREIVESIREPLGQVASDALLFTLLTHAVSAGGPAEFRIMQRLAASSAIMWSDDLMQSASTLHLAPGVVPDRKTVISTIKSKLFPPPMPRRRSPDNVAAHEAEDSEAKPLHRDDIAQGFRHIEKLTGAESRDRQLEYATFIGQAINAGGRFAIEAGTGTGKTRGYLIPACELVRRVPGQKVVIATATKNLQNQVLKHELPKVTVRKSLYQDIQGALLKGKSNYICLTALGEKYDEFFRKAHDSTLARSRLAWLHLAILCIREEGDLEAETISGRFTREYLDLRDDVNAGASCTADLCRHGLECVYPRVQARAEQSDVIITNHYKLPSISDELTDQASVLIIDEADQFPDNYRSAVEVELTKNEVTFRFVQRVSNSSPKRRGFAQLVRDHFDELEAKGSGNSTVNGRCRSLAMELIEACERIEQSINDIGRIASLVKGREARWQKIQSTQERTRLIEVLGDLGRGFNDVGKALDGLLEYLEADKFIAGRERQLRRYIDLASDLNDKAVKMAESYGTHDFVHVIADGWSLRRVPMNIGTLLDRGLYPKFTTTVFTSATLYVNDRLDLFRQELGLDAPFEDARRIDSPFDYPRNVLGAVATSLPVFDFQNGDRNAWLDAVARAIVQLVTPLYGRSLVLLTNTREMHEVHDRAKELLEEGDIEVLIQNGTSNLEISTFRSVEYSVLFGVDRFWTGVDFPGPTLSQVIVVRMPNPHLGDPLIEHRRQYMGRDFWQQFYDPIARLKLRQGFGRLMRADVDRGLFVTLDPRVKGDVRYRRYEAELPVELRRAPDIGDKSLELPAFTERGLKHLELTPEYEERRGQMMPAGQGEDADLPF